MNRYFKENKAKIGSWITLPNVSIAEIMAKSGFDWLAVDLEHSSITINQAEELIRVINLCDVRPLVRLTSNNSDLIKRVMDAGAHGIIIPMVNSVDDLLHASDSIKYPPNGKRGVGLARAQGYGANFEEYLEWQKTETLIIAQIEHKDALENLESIFESGLLDSYIIGPYDLSGSLGIPGQFDHPIFIEALEEILSIGNSKSIPSGIHIIEPNLNELADRIKEGYEMIAYSLDIRMIDSHSRAVFKHISQII